MRLVPRLPDGAKIKMRDTLIPKILKFLTIKRSPDASRAEFFVHAEAFAALVHLEFVSIQGAVTTILTLLRKPDNRCAAVTMLGKTVELCTPQLVAQGDPGKMGELRAAVMGLQEEAFRYDVNYVRDSLGWSDTVSPMSTASAVPASSAAAAAAASTAAPAAAVSSPAPISAQLPTSQLPLPSAQPPFPLSQSPLPASQPPFPSAQPQTSPSHPPLPTPQPPPRLSPLAPSAQQGQGQQAGLVNGSHLAAAPAAAATAGAQLGQSPQQQQQLQMQLLQQQQLLQAQLQAVQQQAQQQQAQQQQPQQQQLQQQQQMLQLQQHLQQQMQQVQQQLRQLSAPSQQLQLPPQQHPPLPPPQQQQQQQGLPPLPMLPPQILQQQQQGPEAQHTLQQQQQQQQQLQQVQQQLQQQLVQARQQLMLLSGSSPSSSASTIPAAAAATEPSAAAVQAPVPSASGGVKAGSAEAMRSSPSPKVIFESTQKSPSTANPSMLVPVDAYSGHQHTILAVGVDESSGATWSAAMDGSLIMWGGDGKPLQSLLLGAHYVCGMDLLYSPSSLLLAAAPRDDMSESQPASNPNSPCILQLTGGEGPGGGGGAGAGGGGGGWQVTGRLDRNTTSVISCIKAIGIQPDTAFITAESIAPCDTSPASPRDRICCYDLGGAPFSSLHPVRQYTEHEDLITCLTVFPPNPNLFLSGSRDSTIRLWDRRASNAVALLGSPSPSGRPQAHAGMVTALDACPATVTVASGGMDGYLKLWDLRSLQSLGNSPPLGSLNLDESPILKLASSMLPGVVAVSTVRGLYLADLSGSVGPSGGGSARPAGGFQDGRQPGRYHDIKWAHGRRLLFAGGDAMRVDVYGLQ
ncbi:hypothetical protein CLOM_g14742 [Closterium sp. NIES-68]|nr:hypothetical protein CLOM_g14742 [Closterium sp. NIES-68]